jgi:glutathione S-transferase
MKLYYSPGACSLAAHIVASEAGVPVDLVKVDLGSHKLADGTDYYSVNPRGYVPAIKLDDGSVMTEASVLTQFIADQKPDSNVIPKMGTKERYKAMQWLAFIATELHKQFSPLFDKSTPEATQNALKAKIVKRLGELNEHLKSNDFILGKTFSAADAYGFAIINWTNFVNIDLKPFPAIQAWFARVAQRPKVHAALVAEGLAKAA